MSLWLAARINHVESALNFVVESGVKTRGQFPLRLRDTTNPLISLEMLEPDFMI